MKIHLPTSIQKFIGSSQLHKNKVGQSPADVYSFQQYAETFYLKISEKTYANTTYSVLREAKVLDWLQGKLLVPELILMDSDHQYEYMITQAVRAQPIEKINITNDQYYINLYTEALHQLQAITIEDCPFYSDRHTRLKESRYLIDHGLIDELEKDEMEPHVWEEFQSHEALWQYLNQQNFQEDWVFSHGDITDTNLFIDKNERLYFLDVGRAGIADRFVDITFVERCLREDCSKATARSFLNKLEYDDPFKRDYFLKLDELN